MAAIILFDGVCNLCNYSVQFILKRDPDGYFKFCSLQSTAGRKLLEDHGLADGINSFVLIENGNSYVKSSAALRVCRNLTGAWKLLFLFRIIPISVRDLIYNIISNNRYKWFGKKENCMIPTPELRTRFLDD